MNNVTFQPNFDILFSKNIFETLKVDTLLTFNVLSMDIKSHLQMSFDVDILTALTHKQLISTGYLCLCNIPTALAQIQPNYITVWVCTLLNTVVLHTGSQNINW